MPILQELANLFVPLSDKYYCAARLDGHKGPINCLVFSRDGQLLASGGTYSSDDKNIRIWSMRTKKCQQVIEDHGKRWGQITCITWLASEVGDPSTTLCFGTGRGRILVYRRLKSGLNLIELSNHTPFPPGGSIEAITYDGAHSRLAVTGHHGHIKLYSVEKNGTMSELWAKSREDCIIPRSVHFYGNNGMILICYLESGELSCHDVKTGEEKWCKILKSGIGNASICPAEKFLLVDNLSTGFDLYHLPRTSPSRTFTIPTTDRYIKAGVFAESSTLVICGSDHGQLYVFDIGSADCTQKLAHTKNEMVQSVGTITTSESHLIASGSSGAHPDICIWEKVIHKPNRRRANNMQNDRPASEFALGFLILIIFMWTSSAWLPFLVENARAVNASLQPSIISAYRVILGDHLNTPRIRAQETLFDAKTVLGGQDIAKIIEYYQKELENEADGTLNVQQKEPVYNGLAVVKKAHIHVS